jgi:hypothetical protein
MIILQKQIDFAKDNLACIAETLNDLENRNEDEEGD